MSSASVALEKFFGSLTSFKFHYVQACLRPYGDFSSFNIFVIWFRSFGDRFAFRYIVKPSDLYFLINVSRIFNLVWHFYVIFFSPFIYAVSKSIWLMCRYSSAIIAMIVQIPLSFGTGTNVFGRVVFVWALRAISH